ncbi:MAG: tyrosine-type recombinase/integrase [bacterium]|nr:tyrosine-type recombinase/integrase [bacterium]
MATELRKKFENYMTLQRFSTNTRRSYLTSVKGLAAYYKKSPDLLTKDQIKKYFQYLIEERKLAWASCNSRFTGISCFYKNVLKWDELNFYCPPRPRIKQLPTIISEEEVKRLFSAINNLKHRVVLKTLYSAGLRVSEVICLKPEHIESDSSRMMIRVEQGKGRKDRYTVLSQHLLLELKNYWQKYRPPGPWLFPGKKKYHICTETVSSIFRNAKKKPA